MNAPHYGALCKCRNCLTVRARADVTRRCENCGAPGAIRPRWALGGRRLCGRCAARLTSDRIARRDVEQLRATSLLIEPKTNGHRLELGGYLQALSDVLALSDGNQP